MLIDSLHQQLKSLEQDRGIYDGQIVAQRQETQSAQQILKEAAGEMEMISTLFVCCLLLLPLVLCSQTIPHYTMHH